MSDRFDIDVGYRDPWDDHEPEPRYRPHPDEYADQPVRDRLDSLVDKTAADDLPRAA